MTRIKTFYYHTQPGRIGELAWRTFVVRNLYPEDQYDLTIVFFPLEKSTKVNKSIFDNITRGINVDFASTVEEYRQLMNKGLTLGVDGLCINESSAELWLQFVQKFSGKVSDYKFELTEEEIHKGQELRTQLNIPQTAKIVTLHVREPGFLTGEKFQYNNYRDANISNYISAITYLIRRGYYVVRLGDKSMQTISSSSSQFIDAPHHLNYSDFFDLYFVATSDFYIGVPSGPSTVAAGFHIPQLMTNVPPESTICGFEKDLYVFKHCYSHQLGRCLSYEEMVTSQLADYNRAHLYQESGIELLENTPSDLLAATIEMKARIDGNYDKNNEIAKINKRVKNIQKKAHILRGHIEKENRYPYIPLYGLYLSNAQISLEYIRRHPDFLGHEWPEIEWGFHSQLKDLPISMGEFSEVLS